MRGASGEATAAAAVATHLRLVLDVRVDQQAVSLGVDVLHGDLETVEEARLGDLHLRREALHQVLVHDAVRRREERQHVADEVALVVVEPLLPVHLVIGQVDLLRGPEARLGLLVLRHGSARAH